MSAAQPARSTHVAPEPTDAERLVDRLSDRIGGLGVELADVAGSVQEVTGRMAVQSERFGHLQKTAETMVSANHGIADASQAVHTAASAAVGEITQSRGVVDSAVKHIKLMSKFMIDDVMPLFRMPTIAQDGIPD